MTLQMIDLYVFLAPFEDEEDRIHIFPTADAAIRHLHNELRKVFAEPDGKLEVTYETSAADDNGFPILTEKKTAVRCAITNLNAHMRETGTKEERETWEKRFGQDQVLLHAWEVVTTLANGYAWPWGGHLLHLQTPVEVQEPKPLYWQYKTLRLPPGEDRDVPINHWAGQGWALMSVTTVDKDGNLLAVMQKQRE